LIVFYITVLLSILATPSFVIPIPFGFSSWAWASGSFWCRARGRGVAFRVIWIVVVVFRGRGDLVTIDVFVS
jgi:hypothetical protein